MTKNVKLGPTLITIKQASEEFKVPHGFWKYGEEANYLERFYGPKKERRYRRDECEVLCSSPVKKQETYKLMFSTFNLRFDLNRMIQNPKGFCLDPNSGKQVGSTRTVAVMLGTTQSRIAKMIQMGLLVALPRNGRQLYQVTLQSVLDFVDQYTKVMNPSEEKLVQSEDIKSWDEIDKAIVKIAEQNIAEHKDDFEQIEAPQAVIEVSIRRVNKEKQTKEHVFYGEFKDYLSKSGAKKLLKGIKFLCSQQK